MSLAGCGSFEGDFHVENGSDRTVWVHELEGFASSPPIGILSPGVHSSASMNDRQRMPDQCTIIWWYMIKDDDYEPSDRAQRSVVDLSHIPKNRRLELVLRFGSDYEWTADVEEAY